MNALVIGANGTVGKGLLPALRQAGHRAFGATRLDFDLREVPDGYATKLEFETGEHIEAVYLCAAMTRFIDCEDNPDAYRINVDAQVELAKQFSWAQIVYLSSEAVERALRTNYGLHKAMAEASLRAVCDPVIVRLSKVGPTTLNSACAFLASMADARPGIYRWRSS